MIKKFLHDSIIYTFLNLLTKGIHFLLLPLYAQSLSKPEYAVFDYLTLMFLILNIFITAEIAQALMRFLPEQKDNEDRHKLLSSAIIFIIFVYLILISLLFFLKGKVSNLLFETEQYHMVIFLVAVMTMLNTIFYTLSVYYRSLLQSSFASVITISSALSIALPSIISLYVFKTTIIGMLLNQILFLILGLALFNYFFLKLHPKHFSLSFLKHMLCFSYPLVISSFGVLIAMFIDRYCIEMLLSLDKLAIYSLASRIAAVGTFLTLGFQFALAPLIYHNLDNLGHTVINVAKLLILYIIFSCIALFIVWHTKDHIVGFVGGIEYQDATLLVFILSSSILIHNAHIFFPGLSIAKKTFLLGLANFSSAFINIFLNLLLIPQYGLLGAAIATLLSSCFFLSLNIFLSEKDFSYTSHLHKLKMIKSH